MNRSYAERLAEQKGKVERLEELLDELTSLVIEVKRGTMTIHEAAKAWPPSAPTCDIAPSDGMVIRDSLMFFPTVRYLSITLERTCQVLRLKIEVAKQRQEAGLVEERG